MKDCITLTKTYMYEYSRRKTTIDKEKKIKNFKKKLKTSLSMRSSMK